MQYHASLITADGAYHCPVGSIMAIFTFFLKILLFLSASLKCNHMGKAGEVTLMARTGCALFLSLSKWFLSFYFFSEHIPLDFLIILSIFLSICLFTWERRESWPVWHEQAEPSSYNSNTVKMIFNCFYFFLAQTIYLLNLFLLSTFLFICLFTWERRESWPVWHERPGCALLVYIPRQKTGHGWAHCAGQ